MKLAVYLFAIVGALVTAAAVFIAYALGALDDPDRWAPIR